MGNDSSFHVQAKSEFKIFSQLLVGANREANHLFVSRLNLKFKIFSQLLVGANREANHHFVSRLNLKFKIFSELLVGNIWGDQSSFHVQAKS